MIDYKSAGVNIDAGNEVVRRIKKPIKKTFDAQVLTDLGGFSALYDLQALYKDYTHPVLVQSIDGLGTKPMLASMVKRFDTLGYDLLSATANDILVCGAKPLTLLDYIGSSHIHPDAVVTLIESISRACLETGVSLVGGETAEMPGIYQGHEYDIVGVITGVVDKQDIITGSDIKAGDAVLGFGSSGLHTNGYSLARKLCFEVGQLPLTTELGDMLLAPHINYTLPVLALLEHYPIKGMAHITGGGLLENIPRVLPKQCSVALERNSWPRLPVFDLLLELGKLTLKEAYRSFNMGIGYVLIVEQDYVHEIHKFIRNAFSQFNLYTIGQVVVGEQKVQLV
ncbi:MAG: phosphoribosylformylglycinamidine cyclo-ligase [Rickettsiella sp.]|nr:phosphoribosylformylglycinamidine cyclo-ligase [Rickettsiella sp.]